MIGIRREYRSPYRAWGWVLVGSAVVGTTAFFVGVDWSEFEGTVGDYLNLAKGPISAGLLVGLGLHMSWCALVISETDILVKNIFRSVRLRWTDVIRIAEDENGVVRVESGSVDPVRVCALSRMFPYGRRRRWQTAAIDELFAAVESHKASR